MRVYTSTVLTICTMVMATSHAQKVISNGDTDYRVGKLTENEAQTSRASCTSCIKSECASECLSKVCDFVLGGNSTGTKTFSSLLKGGYVGNVCKSIDGNGNIKALPSCLFCSGAFSGKFVQLNATKKDRAALPKGFGTCTEARMEEACSKLNI